MHWRAAIESAHIRGRRAPRSAQISVGESVAVFVAMFVVHVWLLWFASWHESAPFNDVTTVYRQWLEQARSSGKIPGVHAPLVYPVLAIVPMWFAELISSPEQIALGWVAVVFLLNCIPLYLLAVRNRESTSDRLRLRAAWFWVVFLALLGPAGIGRIDAVTVPLVITGLLLARRRPFAAGGLLTVGAWIKVWPAAVFAALVTVHRKRLQAIYAGAAVTLFVVATAVLLGGADTFPNLLSFVTGQTGRGLQIESVGASPFLMLAAVEAPGYLIFFNTDIITVEITGPGTAVMAKLLTPLMFALVVGLICYAVVCMRRGAGLARLLPALSLALVVAFIVANKVGSPQFYTWLAAPIVVGLIWDGRRYGRAAIYALVIAALTQIIYPFAYGSLMMASDLAVLVIVVRNALLLALLVNAVRLMRPISRPTFEPVKSPSTIQ